MDVRDKYYNSLRNLETIEHGTFYAIAPKITGCSLGTLYRKEEDGKQYLGKIGRFKINPSFVAEDAPLEMRLICQIERDTIREKIAYDLYRIFSKQVYLMPPAFLYRLPIENEHLQKNSLRDSAYKQYADFFKACEQQNVDTTWRVMSDWIECFMDLSKAKTNEDGEKKISFMDYVRKYGRPPKKILKAKKESVPLVGLMELLATARALADTDCLGGAGRNIGFVWDKDHKGNSVARVVKIDPGESFRFATADDDTVFNRVNVILSNWGNSVIHMVVGDDLDLRNIQFTNLHFENLRRNVTLVWEKLHQKQQKKFLAQLKRIVNYLLDSDQADKKRMFCFYREGAFNKYIKYKSSDELPGIAKKEAKNLSKQMKAWLQKQKEIYSNFIIQPKKSRSAQLLKETGRNALAGSFQGGMMASGGLIVQVVRLNYTLENFSYGEAGAATVIVLSKIVHEGIRNVHYSLLVIPLAPLLTRHIFHQWINPAEVTESPLQVAVKSTIIDVTAVLVTGFAIQYFRRGASAVKFGTTVVSESLTSILTTTFVLEIALDRYGPEYAHSIEMITRIAGSVLGGAAGAIVGGFIAKWNSSWKKGFNLFNLND